MSLRTSSNILILEGKIGNILRVGWPSLLTPFILQSSGKGLGSHQRIMKEKFNNASTWGWKSGKSTACPSFSSLSKKLNYIEQQECKKQILVGRFWTWRISSKALGLMDSEGFLLYQRVLCNETTLRKTLDCWLLASSRPGRLRWGIEFLSHFYSLGSVSSRKLRSIFWETPIFRRVK